MIIERFPLAYLKNKRTLCTGQADDLKIEGVSELGIPVQVWLSRCTVEDGEPYNNKVTVMIYFRNQWVTRLIYQAE